MAADVLEAEDLPTIHFSGDNSELDIVEQIAASFPNIDIAILNAGGAKFDVIVDGAYITFSNEAALEATRILGSDKTVVIHEDSWAHFSQSAEEVVALFTDAGMADAVVALAPRREHGARTRLCMSEQKGMAASASSHPLRLSAGIRQNFSGDSDSNRSQLFTRLIRFAEELASARGKACRHRRPHQDPLFD